LNSILVITRQYSYLKRVEKWVRKLDLPTQGVGSRLYIYSVKNSTAKDLATALSELFAMGDEEITSTEDNVTGPGSMPITLRESDAEEPQQEPADSQNNAEEEPSSDFQIIVADDTNSLLISATPMQYAKVELALSKLDVPPLQVLIEVSIMDVQLTEPSALRL
jgi:general secretion pathway protein D